jgi:Uma2 family endonuclease
MDRDKARAEAISDDRPEPAWEAALLFPPRGQWAENDYLLLPTNRLVELVEGSIEVLAMPSKTHQLIVMFLAQALRSFLDRGPGGIVITAPYPVRLATGRFREPDVVCLVGDHAARAGERFAEGADLVIEVVSPSDPDRDLVTKREEYARAAIREYWIVEPESGMISVLGLEVDRYVLRGAFGRDAVATSAILDGFSVAVAEALQIR